MKVKQHLFSFSKNLDSLLAGFLGFFIIQIFSKHSGIGVSPDSVAYLSTARHILTGHGFRSFDSLPMVDFPFAYPFFLTIISFFTGMDPLQFGFILNGILFGLLLYISGAVMNGFQQSSGWYKRILLFCILLTPALQEVYSMLWSETIFLLLVLLFIFSFSNYLTRSERKWLIVSAGICALACITRYAGVFLPLTGLSLIFFLTERTWRNRIGDSMIFGILSLSLLSVNIFRNLWLTGLATGPRPGNHENISTIIENFGGVVCDWLLLDRNPASAFIFTGIVLLLFILTIIFTRKKSNGGLEHVMSVTGLVYCLFMIITSAITRYEQFTNRLLSPLSIPLLWSLSWWIPAFLSRLTHRMKWAGGIVVLFAAAGFLNIQLKADYEYYDGVKDAGIPGYQEDEISRSEIVQWLEKNKTSFDRRGNIHSNAGDAVYFFTGLTAKQLPFTEFPDKVQEYFHPSDSAGGREYLVWFRNLDNPEMPDLNSILQNKKMILLQQLTDGAVYISNNAEAGK